MRHCSSGEVSHKMLLMSHEALRSKTMSVEIPQGGCGLYLVDTALSFAVERCDKIAQEGRRWRSLCT